MRKLEIPTTTVTVDGVELRQIDGEEKPRGLCWCGCGTPTPISTRTNSPARLYAGFPVRYIRGHHAKLPIERYRIDENGCWVWTGFVNDRGYGQVCLAGRRKVQAHRLLWEHLRGPIPEGYDIDHLCRVTSCVNPDHLEPVTPEENQRRRLEANELGAYATTCGRGHAWADGNEYVTPKTGRRTCRACHRINTAAHLERVAS